MSEIIVISEGKICDSIDEKLRNDTPEEYVRQNVEKRLVNEHKYGKEQIALSILFTMVGVSLVPILSSKRGSNKQKSI